MNQSGCRLKVSAASVTLYQNAEVWRNFDTITVDSIAVSARANNALLGGVSGLSNRFYTSGESVTLTVTPASGITFVNWTSNGIVVSTNNTLNLTITQDTILTANFEKTGNYNITAGTLKDIPDIQKVTNLTLSGNIDARDIRFMRDSMDVLANLDLSGTNIVAYTGTEGTNYHENTNYPANEMPKYSFIGIETGIGKTSLLSIELPASLTSIGEFAFNGCTGLTGALDLPSSLISIGSDAFGSCSGLTSLTLPAGLTSIADHAFSWCSGLTEITNQNPTPITIEASVFNGVNKRACFLKVPSGSVTLYQNAAVWKDFLIDEVYTVNVTVNNSLYGSVTGNGNYFYNTQDTLTATANQGYVFENWTSNGNVISNANPLIFTVTQDTTITANFIPDVGIEDANDVINAIVVYPNPVQDRLTISGLSGKEDITIIDLIGRTLYTGKSDGAREMQIPFSSLTSGMYFVRISTSTKTKTMKIIKQ
jgi:hypothetical protein